jgi:hypothetical protein
MLNFTISELIHSDTAIKYNINNMPDIKSLDNMLNLIFYCLQPIRDKIGKPIIITSGYRCAGVNRLVGGALNSQHTKGQAADIAVYGMSHYHLFMHILNSGIEYDQLILEPNWVHISYVKGKNRKMNLRNN